MDNSSRTLLFTRAFLVAVVCSAILPVSGLPCDRDISSHGTISYSTNTWNLVITVTPASGGTTSLGGEQVVSVGQNVTVSAMAEQDYYFVNWRFDDVVSTSNPITIPPQPEGTSHSLVASFAVATGKYVGFRCSGERTADYCISVADRYKTYITETKVGAGGLWLIPQSKCLYKDSGIESSLNKFDSAGIKVYISPSANVPEQKDQYKVGSKVGKAAVPDLISGLVNNYAAHSCVIGIGVDLELCGYGWDDFSWAPATNSELLSWRNKVPSKYKLYIKHWQTSRLPSKGSSCYSQQGMVFNDMCQGFSSGYSGMLSSFRSWASHVSPAKTMFQVGYNSDKGWWDHYSNPPRDLANALFSEIPSCVGVYWHTQSITTVFPETVTPQNPAPMP